MENATIKEIIIQKLMLENYSTDTIAEALKELKKIDLKSLEKNNSSYLKNIKNMEELLNLSHETFVQKTNINNKDRTIKERIFKTYINRIIEAIKKIIKEKKVQNKEKYLENYKEVIYMNLVKLVQYFIKIGLKERIRQSIEKTQDKNNQKLDYIRINLNDKELRLLKKLLINELRYKDIINSPDKYENLMMLEHIKEELEYYLQKIEYKNIVDRNYRIEDMNLVERDINTLRQYNLNRVSDIIEYSIEELSKLPRFGQSICKKLVAFFKEKNIASLTDSETVLKNMNMENAGIIKRKEK